MEGCANIFLSDNEVKVSEIVNYSDISIFIIVICTMCNYDKVVNKLHVASLIFLIISILTEQLVID